MTANEKRSHRLRCWGPAAFAGLLMVCGVPDLGGQTTGIKKGDSTAVHLQPKKPTSSPRPAGKDTTSGKGVVSQRALPTEDDEERDSTGVEMRIGAEPGPGAAVERDTSLVRVIPSVEKDLSPPDEEESDAAWELVGGVDYDTWSISRGVDRSRGIPAVTPSVILTHESGVSLEVDAMYSWSDRFAFSMWSCILGYEYAFTDWATGSLQYSRYRYNDSEENAVASQFTSWSLAGNFDARVCLIDLTLDLYPSDVPILYLTLDVSKAFTAGDFTFTPMFETCYLSEKILVKRLPPLQSFDLHLRGIASISLQCDVAWQATDRFALSFNPQFIRFPIGEITSKLNGFASTLSATYTFDF